MTMRRSRKWPVRANAAFLQERPNCDGLLSRGKVCEGYKVMTLLHQTDRLERDHKALIFRRVKIIANREQNMFSVFTNETICTKDHTVLTFLS
jgi:hypothetical protein